LDSHRLPVRARAMDGLSQIKGLRGGVRVYSAQGIPLIDAEIAEKGHFWMKTIWLSSYAFKFNIGMNLKDGIKGM